MASVQTIQPLQPISRTLVRCLVCGSAEVRTDEVVDRGLVFLAECPRCEHRWTSREPIAPAPRPQPSPRRAPARVAREVAPAA